GDTAWSAQPRDIQSGASVLRRPAALGASNPRDERTGSAGNEIAPRTSLTHHPGISLTHHPAGTALGTGSWKLAATDCWQLPTAGGYRLLAATDCWQLPTAGSYCLRHSYILPPTKI